MSEHGRPMADPGDRPFVPRPRVLLADDHRMVLDAFANLLAAECDVVGSASDGRALLAAAELRPDVVVIDVAMPRLNGLDAVRQLKRTAPEVGVVILTATEDPAVAAEAFRAGATGYLLKSSAASELLTAIREVYRGRSYVTPLAAGPLVETLLRARATPGPVEPTPRQREVLRLLAEGHTMKSIAGLLRITPRTVAFHKYAMMKLLGVASTAALVQYAVRRHMVGG